MIPEHLGTILALITLAPMIGLGLLSGALVGAVVGSRYSFSWLLRDAGASLAALAIAMVVARFADIRMHAISPHLGSFTVSVVLGPIILRVIGRFIASRNARSSGE